MRFPGVFDPLATFCDPFGIVVQAPEAKVEFEKPRESGLTDGELQFRMAKIGERKSIGLAIYLHINVSIPDT